ncbi:hypothetical protein CSC70_13290 [Pseudoxanthomonas kalamensis DSM 18571]|uniref:hypothetical protein n=1 Tax=Pseudoxanthomonas kalamensis TaxID=289483 RepID=UPI001390D7BE|nr:hypothetical protein [Pseudoxanthomonas kalamensis]KAF1708112.1 hypothetical protein CSC70_13290 [Pseudoxanthomonas kalamensis DSM 18571]
MRRIVIAIAATCLLQVVAAAELPKAGLRLESASTQRLAELRALTPAATLHFRRSGDIPDDARIRYIEPGSGHYQIELESNLGQEPRIGRLRWQVSRMPFYGDIDQPIGLVASGLTSQRVFTIDLGKFVPRPSLSAVSDVPHPQSSAQQNASTTSTAPASTRITAPVAIAKTPALRTATTHQAASPSTARPQMVRSGLSYPGMRNGWAPRFYVRVVPVDDRASLQPEQLRAIGRPSEPLVLVWDTPPQTALAPSQFETVSTTDYDIRLVSFVYHPQETDDHWPAGCEEIPRDDGTDALDVISDIPGAVVDLINWASQAYADLKRMAVSLVASFLPFVPESVISAALDSALAAAGIPPSIPNVDQLMNSGADYLAAQMAEQIPVPSAGVWADMALDEAKDRIREETRQGLLDAAKAVAEKQRKDTKWCTTHVTEPFFEATVRNAAANAADNVVVSLHDSAGFFENKTMTIAHMAPGERFTLPIPYRAAPIIPERYHSQIPKKDRERERNEWWDAYYSTKISFTLRASERMDCRADGSCAAYSRKLLQTPTRQWDGLPGYRVGPG